MRAFERRLADLEQASGPRRYFVAYPAEGRFILPGGDVTDADTFTRAVERAGRRAVVIKVDYSDDLPGMADDTPQRRGDAHRRDVDDPR